MCDWREPAKKIFEHRALSHLDVGCHRHARVYAKTDWNIVQRQPIDADARPEKRFRVRR
jgi:hypothetical protein